MSIDLEHLRGKPSTAYVWSTQGGGYKLHSANYHFWDSNVGEHGASVDKATRLQGEDTEATAAAHNLFVATGIGERVIRAQLISPEGTSLRTVPTKVTKRWFGIPRTVTENRSVTVKTGGEPIPLGKIDKSNSTEPAFVVGYDILTRSDKLRGLYLDGHKRPGRRLTVASVMTEAEADTVFAGLMENPHAVRDFAAFVLRECVGIHETDVPLPNYSLIDEHVTQIQFATDLAQPPNEGIVVPNCRS